MLTRRAFLLGATGLVAGAAANLILPSWVRYAERFIEAEGEPLLEPPQRELTTIDAIILPGMDDYRLTIGDPFEEPPAMTWRELYEAYFSDTSDCESYAAFCEEYAGGIQSPDELAPGYFVLESWLGANAAPDT